MAKRTKQPMESTPESKAYGTSSEKVLVTFSSPVLERFNIENNQALVELSELKENEKLVESNGKTYLQVSEPTHTYLL